MESGMQNQKVGSSEEAKLTPPASLTANSAPSLTPFNEKGFTLIELMIVMAIIGVLATVAIPSFISSIKMARESVLKEDLQVLRGAIDSYTMDKQKAPQSLEDLVQEGYLKSIPEDPMTHSKETWVTDSSDALHSIDQTDTGIDDVHSGAQDSGTDGTAYSTW
jgi:general secretion pathway protein G